MHVNVMLLAAARCSVTSNYNTIYLEDTQFWTAKETICKLDTAALTFDSLIQLRLHSISVDLINVYQLGSLQCID